MRDDHVGGRSTFIVAQFQSNIGPNTSATRHPSARTSTDRVIERYPDHSCLTKTSGESPKQGLIDSLWPISAKLGTALTWRFRRSRSIGNHSHLLRIMQGRVECHDHATPRCGNSVQDKHDAVNLIALLRCRGQVHELFGSICH
jgi:hypothetical protein